MLLPKMLPTVLKCSRCVITLIVLSCLISRNGKVTADYEWWDNLVIGGKSPTDTLLYEEIVERNGMLFQTQSANVAFVSEEIITAIEVVDLWNDGTGGQVSLRSGGLGEKNVYIKIRSQPSRGFKFGVKIWGHSPYYLNMKSLRFTKDSILSF